MEERGKRRFSFIHAGGGCFTNSLGITGIGDPFVLKTDRNCYYLFVHRHRMAFSAGNHGIWCIGRIRKSAIAVMITAGA